MIPLLSGIVVCDHDDRDVARCHQSLDRRHTDRVVMIVRLRARLGRLRRFVAEEARRRHRSANGEQQRNDQEDAGYVNHVENSTTRRSAWMRDSGRFMSWATESIVTALTAGGDQRD